MNPSTDYLPSPGRTVASGAFLATAVSASTLGLGSVVVPGAWRAETLGYVVLVTAVIVLARIGLRAWRGTDVGTLAALVPTFAGLLLSVWLVLARFGTSTAGATSAPPLDPLVGPGSVTTVLDMLRTLPEMLAAHSAPVDPYEAVVLLVVVGALGTLTLADTVVAVRVPALAGVAVVLLWLPPLLILQDMPLAPVVVTGLALLGLLAVDDPYAISRRYPASRPRRRTRENDLVLRAHGTRAARWGALTVVTVVTTLALGAVLPRVPGWGSVDAPDVRTGVGQVGENLDLARSLGERSQRKAFSYTISSPAERGPLRTGTLYAFDGRTWEPHPAQARSVDDGTVLWPAVFSGAVRAPVTLDLRAEEMRGSVVPVPLEPRTVTRPSSSNGYDATRDVVTTDPELSSDDEATITFLPRSLVADTLRTASVPRDASEAPAGDQEAVALSYLLPETWGSEEVTAVREIAEGIVSGARTDYDRAVAIQDHLRTDPGFTYTLEVPEPTSDNAVVDFLADGRGYCVQFATAMVTLARSLGMPARLAVGYLPGRSEGERYVVRGRDAHAWPEIYFNGLGWVRFEPTPGTQSGLAPSYTLPEPDSTATPSVEPTVATPTPDANPSSVPTSAPSPTAQSPGGGEGGGTVPWLVGGVATLVLLGAGAVVMLRRRAEARRDVEAAWRAVLREARRDDLVPATGETLRAFAERVGDPTGGVDALARAVERARFAPGAPVPAPDAVARLEQGALAGLEAVRSRR